MPGQIHRSSWDHLHRFDPRPLEFPVCVSLEKIISNNLVSFHFQNQSVPTFHHYASPTKVWADILVSFFLKNVVAKSVPGQANHVQIVGSIQPPLHRGRNNFRLSL